MQGNFIMLQKDDLKQVVAEMVEELVGKKSQTDLPVEESDEYFTRDQVCERLHITYTTLWRMQKEGNDYRSQVGRTKPLFKEGNHLTCEIERSWLE